jgi:hypothetical protein
MASGEEVERLMRWEEDQGFYPIREVVKLLETYASARENYPDFVSYGPVLIESLAADAAGLARAYRLKMNER